MNVKSILISILFIMAFSVVRAESPIRWGVEAGVNFSKPTDMTDMKCGFNAGVTGELSLSRGWFVDAALKLSSQPLEFNGVYEIYGEPIVHKSHFSMTPYSLLLPVHIGYGFKVGSKARLFGAIGPYIGYGLWGGGERRYTVIENGKETTTGGDINNPFRLMKRFQAGGDVRIGAELCGHYTISAGYLMQFNNMMRSGSSTSRNSVFSISVGYKF